MLSKAQSNELHLQNEIICSHFFFLHNEELKPTRKEAFAWDAQDNTEDSSGGEDRDSREMTLPESGPQTTLIYLSALPPRGLQSQQVMVVIQLLSRVLFVTPQTVACQAPLSMGLSRQNTRVGCHFVKATEQGFDARAEAQAVQMKFVLTCSSICLMK